MRFRLVEDFVFTEQSTSQANANTATKNLFKKLAINKGTSIELPKGTVVHHIVDDKGSDGLKDNSWANVVIIPSIENNSSYAEMLHRIITVFSKMPKGTSLETFFKQIEQTEAYTYNEEKDSIGKVKIRDLMIGG